MKQSLLPAALALLLGLAGGFLASGAMAPAPPTASQPASEDFAALRKEIAALRAAVTTRPAPVLLAATERSDLPSEVGESAEAGINQTLARIERRIVALEGMLAAWPTLSNAPGGAPEEFEPAPKRNQQEVARVGYAALDDNEAAREALFGLTPQQALLRFGVPNATNSRPNGSVTWWYETREGHPGLILTFQDAIVTTVYPDEP